LPKGKKRRYSQDSQFELIGDPNNPRGSFKGTPEESFQKYLDDTAAIREIEREHDIWKPKERDRYYTGDEPPIDKVDRSGIPRHYWMDNRFPLSKGDVGYGKKPHRNPLDEIYARWKWEKAGSPYVAMYPNDLLRKSSGPDKDREYNRAFFTRGITKPYQDEEGNWFRGASYGKTPYSDDVSDTVHVSSKLFPTLGSDNQNRPQYLPTQLQDDYEAEEAHALQNRDTEPAVRDSLYSQHGHQYDKDMTPHYDNFMDWVNKDYHLIDSSDRYKDIHKFEGQAHRVIEEANMRRARWVNTMPKDVVKNVKKRLREGESWEDIVPEFGWDNKYRKYKPGKEPANYKELASELKGKNWEDVAKDWPVYEGPGKKYE
jgi:hypothetical protein